MKDLFSITFLIFAVYGGLIGQTFSTPFKHIPLARSSGAQFGYAVDISGDYFVIGAPFETDDQSGSNSLADAGAVYIFERNQAGSWVEVQKLVPSDRSVGDQFGFSVAMEGDQIVVGAPEEDHNESGNQFFDGSGSIYVFEKNPAGVWLETAKLVAWDRDAQDFFGYAVGISNARILVGAEREDHNATGGVYQPSAGSAYVFEKDINGNWQYAQKLVAQDRSTSDFFGSAVAICDSQIVIGAYREDEDANGLNTVGSAGSCYIFELGTSGVWAQTAKLVAPDRASSDFFGFSVAIDTNRMVAGAYAEDHDSSFGNRASSAGSAYVFSKHAGGTWSFEQKLTASDREVGDEFGYSLDILGDTIVVGAHQEDIDQGTFSISGAGSIYIFASSSGSWSQRAKVFAQAYGTQDYFGRAVSIDPCGIVVGAPFSDFTTNDEAGAAFFVDTKPTPLSLSLLSFTGTALPTGNQLDWQTRSESTEGSFWVERREPQTGEFLAIGLVERQPSEGRVKSYRFLDASPPAGRSLYRLKMLDLDGTVSYSKLVELLPERRLGLRVFPNPAKHRVSFRTRSSTESLRQIELYDLAGRLMREVPLWQVSVSQYDLMLEGLPKGVYGYQVVTSEGHYSGRIELSK